MDGRTLCSKLNYLGMERNIRKLAIKDKLATVEEIAMMTLAEICNLVSEKYEVVYAEPDEIGLVAKEKMEEYNALLNIISR